MIAWSIRTGVDDVLRWKDDRSIVRTGVRGEDQSRYLHPALIIDRLLDRYYLNTTLFVAPARYEKEVNSPRPRRSRERRYKNAVALRRGYWYLLTASLYPRRIEPMAYKYMLSPERAQDLSERSVEWARSMWRRRIHIVATEEDAERMALFVRGRKLYLAPVTSRGKVK